MRNSTYFGAHSFKGVVDPSPRSKDLQRPAFASSIQRQILDIIDVRLASFWASIQTKEAAYLAEHGVYWQGILTPTTVPLDGGEVAPNLTLHATDIEETWADLDFALPATLPMSMEIFTHDGPLGKAYTGIVTVRVLGNTWTRSQGFGAESFSFPWTQVVAGA